MKFYGLRNAFFYFLDLKLNKLCVNSIAVFLEHIFCISVHLSFKFYTKSKNNCM